MSVFGEVKEADLCLSASMSVHQDFVAIANDKSHEDFSLEVFLVVMEVEYD